MKLYFIFNDFFLSLAVIILRDLLEIGALCIYYRWNIHHFGSETVTTVIVILKMAITSNYKDYCVNFLQQYRTIIKKKQLIKQQKVYIYFWEYLNNQNIYEKYFMFTLYFFEILVLIRTYTWVSSQKLGKSLLWECGDSKCQSYMYIRSKTVNVDAMKTL